jgi:uncharacterized protein involved in response to NO
MSTFISIEEPPRPPLRRWALWDLGFRPFYLLASGFAALSVALWSLQFTGLLPAPYLAAPIWHAHEMLFGFTLAVIVGFLFTAGRNWTGRPTPTGPVLAVLAALWVAARILVLSPFAWAAALANVAFPLACAFALSVPFIAAGSKRNYFFVALLVALGAASFAVHLAEMGMMTLPAWAGMQLALDIVLFIVCVMGGRVLPMFTNNGVPGAGAQRVEWLDKAALASVLLVLAADALRVPGVIASILLAAAGAAHAARWAFWKPWRTLRAPLVWVLHLAYAWIPAHLMLRAMAAWGWIAPSIATHALTVGAIGGMVIGMMARTAKGHTARPLRADRWDVAAFACVAAAAGIRVLLPLVWPAQAPVAVALSGLLWSSGFLVYFIRYWPVLTRPRLDGKPG